MKLHDAMKELLGQFGSTLLQESRLFSMLADYRAFSDYPAMRQVVKELVARRYLSELYWRSQEESREECLLYAEYLRKSLRKTRRFRAEFAGYAVYSVLFALGFVNTVQEPSDTGFEPFEKPQERTEPEETVRKTGGNGQKAQNAGGSPSNAEQPKPQPAGRKNDSDQLLKRGKEAYSRGDYALAVSLFRQAADKGNPDAQFRIGNLYYNGSHGYQKSYKKAFGWYSKAAAQGNADAQYIIGNFYYFGYEPCTASKTEAAKWYQKAADQGYSTAASRLAKLKGVNTGSIPSAAGQAKPQPQPAPRQNYGDPLLERGRKAYSRGNYSEAAGLFRQAAGNGSADDSRRLGDMFYNGSGGHRKSYMDAFRCYMKAAKQGDAEAQYIIGSFYYYGYRPCVTDAKKAAKWLRLAAEHGHTQAKSMLIMMKK